MLKVFLEQTLHGMERDMKAGSLLTEVRSALSHLDDPARLENHPLAKRLPYVAAAPDLSKGQLLRRTLRLAIEALDPKDGMSVSSTRPNAYQVLYRYAIAKQSMATIARDLAISERQAYRELQRGTEALVQILLEEPQHPDRETYTGEASKSTSVRQAVERLSDVDSQEIDLIHLLDAAINSARHLARDEGIQLALTADSAPLHVTAPRVMLRQAFLNLLSHIVRCQDSGQVVVRVLVTSAEAVVEIVCGAECVASAPSSASPYAIAAELLHSMGMRWTRELKGDHACVRVYIPKARLYDVLIVDDHEGTINLLRRYLRHRPYRVHAARNAQEAMIEFERTRPQAVILDVMMPDRDGWELLEILGRRAGPKPGVVVCSIINDPELALSLGADYFCHKPVSRASLLHALNEILSSTDACDAGKGFT